MAFVHWTQPALRDLDEALHYIATENPHAARTIGQLIKSRVLLLHDFPHAGRSGRIEGTQELIINGTPYTIIYVVTGDNGSERADILRVWHEKRKWPPA